VKAEGNINILSERACNKGIHCCFSIIDIMAITQYYLFGKLITKQSSSRPALSWFIFDEQPIDEMTALG
jgi:hypothetical protein